MIIPWPNSQPPPGSLRWRMIWGLVVAPLPPSNPPPPPPFSCSDFEVKPK